MAKSVFSVVKNNLAVTKYFLLDESRSPTGNRVLTLTRQISGTPVTVDLEFTKDGGVWIRPARYTFTSRVSHFDYAEPETRWTRRKNVMLGLVKKLQLADVWPFISNKTFFTINENCTSFSKTKSLRHKAVREMSEAFQPQKRAKKDRATSKQLEKQATEMLKNGK